MTRVKHADPKTYLALKQQGRILTEQRRGDYIYFAVKNSREVQVGEPGKQVVTIDVIERYKAKLPAGEKWP
ncbi:MAG: hypothetical protein GXP25_23335 [Planctomycetes bacterium]|nr:hypothetical protein [Planctomycetota bacterium]